MLWIVGLIGVQDLPQDSVYLNGLTIACIPRASALTIIVTCTIGVEITSSITHPTLANFKEKGQKRYIVIISNYSNNVGYNSVLLPACIFTWGGGGWRGQRNCLTIVTNR